MKKCIGIVSMYHGSRNYGGLLQAFALCEFLNNHGYDAKQIDLPPVAMNTVNSRIERIKNNPIKFLKGVPDAISSRIRNALFRLFRRDLYESCISRDRLMDSFRESIPHVDTVKKAEEMHKYNNDFDSFICGSDQIWNPYAFRPEYFLKFADENKNKIAYAASIAKKEINNEDLAIIKNNIHNIDFVSVREKNAKELLNGVCDKDIKTVLDPTMLLSSDEWESHLIKSNVSGDYIFCYMLEDDYKRKQFVKRFAKENHLRVVSLPKVSGSATWNDICFKYVSGRADTPFEFLSLIHDAKYIITDSFHAVVFSCIFRKEFLCFECRRTKTLFPRIENLLSTFNCEDRYFIDVDQRAYDVVSNKIDYTSGEDKYKKMREESADFLFSAIYNKKNI